MAWGIGSFEATKSSCLEASYPLVLSRWTANITAREDEFRGAIRGCVASFALVGRKIECPTPAGIIGIVILTGSSTRQEV